MHLTEKFFFPEKISEIPLILQSINSESFSFLSGGITINWHGNSFKNLINIEKIISNQIIETEQNIEIGAGAKISSIVKNIKNNSYFYGLKIACDLIASPQIRNMATIGGNIISHFDFSDTLGFIYLTNPNITYYDENTRLTEKKFSDFISEKSGRFTFPKNYILNSFKFDLSKTDFLKSNYLKESRLQRDIATIGITSFKKEKDFFDIAIASYTPKILIYRNLTMKKLCELFSKLPEPKTDVRATKNYRKQIIKTLLKRSVEI